MISWLHLTDLHFGIKSERWWSDTTHKILMDDLRTITQKEGPWDLVIFTGDLTQCGERGEFEQFQFFLDEIWTLFREIHPSAQPLLLSVPGNHDMQRPSKNDPVNLALGTGKGIDSLWRGEAQYVDAVNSWFSEYTKWWENCPQRPQTGIKKGLLAGDFIFEYKTKTGQQVGFAGMNSSFLDNSREIGPGDLELSSDQLPKQNMLSWHKDMTATFLLTHHPYEWLSSKSKKHYLEAIVNSDTFNAHLCGHLHTPLIEKLSYGGGKARHHWQSMSLFGLKKLPEGVDRKVGYLATKISTDHNSEIHSTFFPRMAVQIQDNSWRMTSDYTFNLEKHITKTQKIPIGKFDPQKYKAAEPKRDINVSNMSWWDSVQKTKLWKRLEKDCSISDLNILIEIIKLCKAEVDQIACEIDTVWYDEDYPNRVLDAMDIMSCYSKKVPTKECVSIMLIPFIRDVIMMECRRWVEGADIYNLVITGATSEPRNVVEQVYAKNWHLIQRASGSQNKNEIKAIVCWLRELVLECLPDIWAPESFILNCDFYKEINELISSSESIELNWLNVLNVSHVISRNAREIVKEICNLSVQNTVKLMMATSGALALPFVNIPEFVIDEYGQKGCLTEEVIFNTFRAIRYEAQGEILKMSFTCDRLNLDYLLTQMAYSADEWISEAKTLAHQTNIIDFFPERLSPHGIKPSFVNSQPSYIQRHITFRLNHKEVKRLLIGANIYDNPGVVIRELYQNSMDACRYRQAKEFFLCQKGSIRSEYAGKIHFTQGWEGKERFIECRDNGVGMNEWDVENLFTVAGKRFHDTLSFSEERARWRRSGQTIDFHPNSSFGIGVFSYFLIANRIEMTTRKIQNDGSKGDAIKVVISSANGLLQIKRLNKPGIECGTAIRLYVYKTDLSTVDTLTHFLTVSEFEVVATETNKSICFQPGIPNITPGQYLRTSDENFWWTLPSHGGILADGLNLSNNHQDESVFLLNLSGSLFPKLDLSRKKISSMDDHLDDILKKKILSTFNEVIGRIDQLPFVPLEFVLELNRLGLVSYSDILFDEAVSKKLYFEKQHYSGTISLPAGKDGWFDLSHSKAKDVLWGNIRHLQSTNFESTLLRPSHLDFLSRCPYIEDGALTASQLLSYALHHKLELNKVFDLICDLSAVGFFWSGGMVYIESVFMIGDMFDLHQAEVIHQLSECNRDVPVYMYPFLPKLIMDKNVDPSPVFGVEELVLMSESPSIRKYWFEPNPAFSWDNDIQLFFQHVTDCKWPEIKFFNVFLLYTKGGAKKLPIYFGILVNSILKDFERAWLFIENVNCFELELGFSKEDLLSALELPKVTLESLAFWDPLMPFYLKPDLISGYRFELQYDSFTHLDIFSHAISVASKIDHLDDWEFEFLKSLPIYYSQTFDDNLEHDVFDPSDFSEINIVKASHVLMLCKSFKISPLEALKKVDRLVPLGITISRAAQDLSNQNLSSDDFKYLGGLTELFYLHFKKQVGWDVICCKLKSIRPPELVAILGKLKIPKALDGIALNILEVLEKSTHHSPLNFIKSFLVSRAGPNESRILLNSLTPLLEYYDRIRIEREFWACQYVGENISLQSLSVVHPIFEEDS